MQKYRKFQWAAILHGLVRAYAFEMGKSCLTPEEFQAALFNYQAYAAKNN